MTCSRFTCRGGGEFFFSNSGRRIAVICEISPTSNMRRVALASWCFTSNEIYPFASVFLKSQPVCRSPWQVLAGYDRLGTVFKALAVHPYVALGKYMIHDWRTFRFFRVVLWLFVHVATCQISVPGTYMIFTKLVQEPLFLAPVLTNKILGRKNASAKCQTVTIEKRTSAAQSPRNSACPVSLVVHYTPVADE